MSNLLPPRALSIVLSRTRARFIIIGALALTICCATVALFLLPAYFHAVYGDPGSTQDVDEKAAERENERRSVDAVRALLGVSPLGKKDVTLHEALRAALDALPQGISVSSITYRAGPPGELVLTGSAGNRAGVNAYREALDRIELYDTVSVPVSALVGALEGNFTISLVGKF